MAAFGAELKENKVMKDRLESALDILYTTLEKVNDIKSEAYNIATKINEEDDELYKNVVYSVAKVMESKMNSTKINDYLDKQRDSGYLDGKIPHGHGTSAQFISEILDGVEIKTKDRSQDEGPREDVDEVQDQIKVIIKKEKSMKGEMGDKHEMPNDGPVVKKEKLITDEEDEEDYQNEEVMDGHVVKQEKKTIQSGGSDEDETHDSDDYDGNEH